VLTPGRHGIARGEACLSAMEGPGAGHAWPVSLECVSISHTIVKLNGNLVLDHYR
jgi:hypothetical protein